MGSPILLVAAAVLLLVLWVPSGHSVQQNLIRAHGATGQGSAYGLPRHTYAFAGPHRPSLSRTAPLDVTLAPALSSAPRVASGLPTSALFAEARPQPPPTTPVVLTFASNSTGCCVRTNFTSPNGTWAMIVLNYTGEAIGGVYDSSYRAYIDGVQVLFGTSPEYGRWTVLKDLTEYEALFHGTTNLTFLFSRAVTNGYFTESVSLLFYPVPPGASPPAEPNLVLPLWTQSYVHPATPVLYQTLTVPSNVTNATLELYAYGFGADEFWYSNQPGFEPNYRQVLLSLNGTPIASVLPFPYVNTGGIDLFLWRPVPAAFTLDDRPYRIDLTGALGLLEGTHNLTASVTGRDSTSDWLIGGALLLNTSAAALPATLIADSYSASGVSSRTDGKTYDDQSANVSYAYRSELTVGGLSYAASTTAQELFENNATFPTSNWADLAGHERFVQSTVVGGSTTDRTLDFPFAMDIGSHFVETSSTNGSYPIYGNFTQSLLNLSQDWNESTVTSVTAAAGPPEPTLVSTVNFVARANGSYSGTEELTSPNAGLILGINSIVGTTENGFNQTTSVAAGPLAWSFSHRLVAAAPQPPGPNDAETVSVDATSASLGAVLSAAPSVVDVGVGAALHLTVVGGTNAYSVAWSGLPPGCSEANALLLTCVPSAAGSYAVSARATDSAGDAVSSGSATLTVHPAPVATAVLARTAIDAGETVNLNSSVAGGTAPFHCQWWIDGEPFGRPVACGTPVAYAPIALGAHTVQVEVVDGAGGIGNSSAVSLAVAAVPSVAVLLSDTQITVGSQLVVEALVQGGTAPYRWVWSANGAPLSSGAGANLTYTATAPGTFVFAVNVTDAVGGSAVNVSNPLTVVNRTTTGSAPTLGGSSSGTWTLYAVVGAIAALAVILAVVMLRTKRTRVPPPRAAVARKAASPRPGSPPARRPPASGSR